MDSMDEATNKQQIKFSVQTVSYQIEDMLKQGKTQFFYSEIAEGDRQYKPCVLRKHIEDVVVALQRKYQEVAVVSRTPGGIVVHKI
jgi:hypothetical protein